MLQGAAPVHWPHMAPPARAARPQTLAGRLLLWHAVALLGLLLVLGVVVDRVLERYFVDQLTDNLAADARAVQHAIPAEGDVQARVTSLGQALGARVTVIRADGVVVADSEHDPASMGNHLDRPEIREALRGGVGVSSRPSETTGIAYRYVALPPAAGRIVRVALPLTAVQSRLATIRLILGLGFGLAAVVWMGVLALIARGLARPLRRISDSVGLVGTSDSQPELPQGGTRELAVLTGAVDRMRREVAARIEELERERNTRDAILSRLGEGIVLFAGDGSVVYENEAAIWLIGILDRLQQVVPAALRDAVEAARRDLARSEVEVVAGTASRSIHGVAVAVPDDDRVLLVLRDVTEERAIDAVRRDFVANASHELKTPAASIQALAETIHTAAGDDPASVPRFAAQLEREAVRLSRIISDLLDLSRLEGETGERAEVRLDRVVAAEAERAVPEGELAGLTVSISGSRPVVVTGSPRDLGLMVRNLMQNAVQYTKAGGRVDVEIGPDDGHAVLVVRDTGVGIPKKDRGRVFERFYRVDRARSRETGGTGLGLSIVKHVVENHGGSVEVDSRLGEGSTFTVWLPLASRT
jgi:two-component system, OmpR family, phosphate regulon sensor histidine kinase PhoR